MNFRKSLTAFFGFTFVVYWLASDETPSAGRSTLDPVQPSIIRTTQSFKLKEVLTKVRPPAHADILPWLKQEAILIGQIDPDPAGTQLRLKEHAQTLTRSDLGVLKDSALNRALTSDERFLAVYMLGLSEKSGALDLLKDIGQSPIPALKSDREYSDEFSIRAHALESVVKRLPPKDSVIYLKKILTKTSDPALAKHAQYWLTRLT